MRVSGSRVVRVGGVYDLRIPLSIFGTDSHTLRSRRKLQIGGIFLFQTLATTDTT